MFLGHKSAGDWRYRVMAVRCAVAPVLHALAPLGLAAARGTALVVDLDEEAPSYPGSTSLAKLVISQPRLSDLRPLRSGVAVLPNGSINPREAAEVVEALVTGWPAVCCGSAPIGVFPPLSPRRRWCRWRLFCPDSFIPRCPVPPSIRPGFPDHLPGSGEWCCRLWAGPISSGCSPARGFLPGAG